MLNLDDQVSEIGAPILGSKPFGRLYDVTFLGILSPTYSHLPGHPLLAKIRKQPDIGNDGSRADHSISVAELALNFCNLFSMPDLTRKYAVAWALTHDIATWALSHTGEAAFASILNTTHKVIRHKIVVGDSGVPKELHLHKHIRQMGLDPSTLALLFSKDKVPFDPQLIPLRNLIHSAITPDTLEGIHRSGKSLGVSVPEPEEILKSIEIGNLDLFDTMVRQNQSKPILRFWRRKMEIYDKYINTRRAILFESRWSDTIRAMFGAVSLGESFALKEKEIIEVVSEGVLLPFSSVNRYKFPQGYRLNEKLKKRRMLSSDHPIKDLENLLVRH